MNDFRMDFFCLFFYYQLKNIEYQKAALKTYNECLKLRHHFLFMIAGRGVLEFGLSFTYDLNSKNNYYALLKMANTSINMSNLVATIESVAAGDMASHEDDPETTIITAEMIEGTTVLRLADGQSINVVQMTESLEDTINVVQVETTDELGDPYSTVDVEEICEIDIDPEEQQHILSEPGAHVVVKTSTDEQSAPGSQKPVPVVLPAVPFSFPGQTFDTKCQKLILNVWDFFRRLKKNPDLLDEIRTPQERAAAALHISAATIGKIGKNFKRTGKLETPGKKRNRAKPIVDSVNAEQEQIIRSVIKEFRDCR